MHKSFMSASWLLTILCLFLFGMWLSRYIFTGSYRYFFIGWNIFLALIPFAVAAVLQKHTYKLPGMKSVALLMVWLFFLPNSFYIITDLIHLGSSTGHLLWYDAAFLFSASMVGVVCGLLSVMRVEKYLQGIIGRSKAMVISVLVMILSGFGIYLGRFDRFNSWDIVLDPAEVFTTVIGYIKNPVVNIRVWGISFVFAALFIVMYGAAKALPSLLKED